MTSKPQNVIREDVHDDTFRTKAQNKGIGEIKVVAAYTDGFRKNKVHNGILYTMSGECLRMYLQAESISGIHHERVQKALHGDTAMTFVSAGSLATACLLTEFRACVDRRSPVLSPQ